MNVARSSLGVVALVLATMAGAASLAAQTPPARSDSISCVVCHTKERVALTAGVHAKHGVNCVTCHGGDPTARSLPAAHRGHFSGKLSKVATAQLCGSCHSDPNKMRQYDLPTGELAQFRTSRHGQLLFGQHNADAPTCTDCHETHVIYPPDDARSMVYPTNIPGTCAKCHADDRLMSKYHLETNQLAEFRKSAHGVALFQHQNFAAPTCVGCHGAHSALPPSVSEIAGVCGRCHALVEQEFMAGPHGPAVRAGRLPACLGCHSNHGTERVPDDSIAATCDRCHAANSKVHTLALALQDRFIHARADIHSSQRAVARLQLAGRRITDYEFRYRTALTSYLQIAQVQHSLDLDQVDALSRRVRSISVDLDAAAETATEQQWEHKLILLPMWFLALSAMALGWLALRALRGRGGGPGGDGGV